MHFSFILIPTVPFFNLNIEIEVRDISFGISIHKNPPSELACHSAPREPRELAGTLPHSCPIRWRGLDRILRTRPSTTPAATKSTRLVGP